MRNLFYLMLVPVTLGAQAIDSAQIHRGTDGYRTVELSFNHEFCNEDDFMEARKKENYFIIDVFGTGMGPARIPLSKVCVEDDSVMLHVQHGVRLEEGKIYHVYLRNITFGGKEPNKPLHRQLKVQPAQTGSVNLRFKKAITRDRADLYLAGEFQKPIAGDAIGNADIRAARPFYPNPTSAKLILAPLFDLRWSSSPNADADTLNFGLESRLHISELFDTSWLYITPKIESDRSFKNTGSIVEFRWLLLSLPLEDFVLEPYVGIEVGRNLWSPVEEASGRLLARPIVRVDMTASWDSSSTWLRAVSVEGGWQRRWPLTNEVLFKVNDDQSIDPIVFSQGPKDYIESKVTFGLPNFFDLYFGYKYGQLPPQYKLVDQQVSAGVRFSVAFQ